MKAFHCDHCGSLVFFENVKCVNCGHDLGFLPTQGDLSAIESAGDGKWRALSISSAEPLFKLCDNSLKYQVCNWMVPASDSSPFCVSCQLNKIIPNLSTDGNQERWRKLEAAKRRVIYTIMRLGLPMEIKDGENRTPLRFNFVGTEPDGTAPTTGHLNGLIVINIVEADDDQRERRRVSLHEPYRTLLGHFRHEIAHYYWDRLIANSGWLEEFRKMFGDENADYSEALKRHYANGPAPDWQTRHVSAYASSHPWEDWAETWAHYFHIVDMMETADSFGLALNPRHPAAKTMMARSHNPFDPSVSFDTVLENWFPLTYALNSINRGMGLLDVYPFALSPKAVEKLRFVHEVVKNSR